MVIRAFRKGQSKDRDLKVLTLIVCHQFLTVNLFSRMDGTRNIIVPEFSILYYMKRARKINLVFILAHQLQSSPSKNRRFFSLCPLITMLSRLNNFREDTTKVPVLKPIEYFDTTRPNKIQIIITGDDGTFLFTST